MCLLFTNLKIKAAMFYHFLPGLQSSHTKRLTCTKFKPSTRVLISFTRAIFFDSSNLVILTVKFTFSCFAFGASSSSSLLRKKTQKNRILLPSHYATRHFFSTCRVSREDIYVC